MKPKISKEFLRLFSVWRTEGLNPIISIVGYSKLLLDGSFGELTEKQKEVITIINYAANAAMSSWKNPSLYLSLISNPNYINPEWQSVSVIQICSTLSPEYLKEADVILELSPKLPNIKTDVGWLKEAIANLIRPSVGNHYDRNFKPKIVAQLKNDVVIIQVHTGLLMPDGEITIDLISYPGNNIIVSDIILQRLGSKLTIGPLPISSNLEREIQGTIFEFALPI